MISIIICSVNKELLEQLEANIRESIGVPYEIIAIDNSVEKKSIAAVYNAGAKAARFDCLCFAHEDVIIHSKDWGKGLKELLAGKTIGLVGVSGAVYKSKYAGTWSSCDKCLYRTHSIQRSGHTQNTVVTNANPDKTKYAQVAVIDGVFMATRKEVFSCIKFDETNFRGFHGYDLDYSLQVGRKYKVVVSFEILLEHFSTGQLNQQWLEASILLHRKWKDYLPLASEAVAKKAAALSDFLACSQVLMIAIKHNYSKAAVIGAYFKLLTTYFRFNRLRHTKTVIKYLVS